MTSNRRTSGLWWNSPKNTACISNRYSYKDTIINKKTGYLANNSNEWIEYIEELINSKEKREIIGQNAKNNIYKNYLIENNYDKWTNCFEEVLK